MQCTANNACVFPATETSRCEYHEMEHVYPVTLHEMNDRVRSDIDLVGNLGFTISNGTNRHPTWDKKLRCGRISNQRKLRFKINLGKPGRPRKVADRAFELSVGVPEAERVKLPKDRESITHKFTVDGTDCYVIVGLYPNGMPGEIFLNITDKETGGTGVGNTAHGLGDCFSVLFSIALQHGVPLSLLIRKFSHVKFAPAGMTSSTNKDLKFADSIVDYLVRWMEMRFLKSNGHKDHWANQFTNEQKNRVADVIAKGKEKQEVAMPGMKRIVAHCQACDKDFYSIEESQKHDNDFREYHRMKDAERMFGNTGEVNG